LQHPGIVEQQINLAVRRPGPVGQSLKRGGIGDIAWYCKGRRASCQCQMFQRGFIPIGQNHPHPAPHRFARQSCANPAGRAGDYGNCHAGFPDGPARARVRQVIKRAPAVGS
jgi:hypothetical protein